MRSLGIGQPVEFVALALEPNALSDGVDRQGDIDEPCPDWPSGLGEFGDGFVWCRGPDAYGCRPSGEHTDGRESDPVGLGVEFSSVVEFGDDS